jgi:signal transduction histidine kinase
VLLVAAAALVAALLFAVLVWRLRRAREESARLRAIAEAQEEFVSIVSHELRTPVTGVSGFLQTALDHWPNMDDAERRRAVGRALANARRLQSLTRDVLDAASLEGGELTYRFEPVDLAEEVDAAVTAAGDIHPDRVFEVHRPLGPVWAVADGDRIHQVIGNLLENAVNHAPADVPVEVSVGGGAEGAVVSVVDHGSGIPAGDRERVFEKFVRSREDRIRGTGLGLYICRRIVEAHGGRIWAEMAPDGRGAAFSFTVPEATEPPATAAHDAAPAGHP